jgi:hypothetical protein
VSSTPYAGFLAAAAAAIGPDGFGYTADATAFENMDLAPGAADVNTFADFPEEGVSSIPLGANTFNF